MAMLRLQVMAALYKAAFVQRPASQNQPVSLDLAQGRCFAIVMFF